jgi:hypothetical protein
MKKTYLLYLLVMGFGLALMQCHRDKSVNRVSANRTRLAHHPQIDSFNALTREQQVKTCAGCHQKEYENEMKGPHANAFIKLHEHFFTDWSDQPEYKNYLDQVYTKDTNSICKACHALPNLYETFLNVPNKNKDSLLAFIETFRLPELSRKAKNDNLMTGVDCLTCHYDGKNVITNAGYQLKDTAGCPSFCSPVGSSLFSSNYNCMVCHVEEAKKTILLPGVTKSETSCIKCHQEYDPSGKTTHYTYWQADGKDKPKPSHLVVFDDISATYNAKKKEVVIEWKNTRVPHPLTMCTETIAAMELIGERNKTIGKGELRLNRRDLHKSNLEPYWAPKPLPGKDGYDIPLDGSTLRYVFSNVDKPINGKLQLKITGGHKEQYWLPDSTQKVSYRKVILL